VAILTFTYPPSPASTLPVGAATAANQVLEIAQLTGIHSDTTSLDGKDFATSAKQDTAQASLQNIDNNTSAAEGYLADINDDTNNIRTSTASIDTKTPALGQALAAASVPVVLTAAQLSTLTPLSTVAVTGPVTDTELRATPVPVSGTVSTGGLTDAELRATPVPVSGTISTDGLTDADLRASPVEVDGSGVTQPISAASLPLPTGAATSANQSTANASLSSIDSKLTSPLAVTGTFFQATQPVSIAASVAVTGPLTDAELRASPVPISGSITATNPSVTATGAAVPADATFVAGSDGTNAVAIKVSAAGVVSVDGSAVTQPVSIAASVAVTGPLTDTQLRATPVPVSGTVSTGGLTDAELRASAVPVSAAQTGTWTVQPGNTANTTAWLVSEEKSASSAITSVAGSASSVSLLASNSSRKNATFFNDSTAILYLKLGTTASTTSYTVQIAASGYYELPLGRIYTGAIDGIWASANGNVRITELS